jgi:hypothetical protein
MSGHILRQSATYDRLAKKFGLATSKERLAGPGRYRWDLIERDINALLMRRRDLPNGRRGTYPNSLVNYIASIYLSCCMVEKRPPPQELVHLIAQQLNVSGFRVKKRKQSGVPDAQQIRTDNPSISNRALAQRLNVPTSTVGRWVKLRLLPPPARGVAE